MTFNELVERAKRQLNAGQTLSANWVESEIDIAACAMQASQRVAHDVMRDPSLRSLLQQEYTVTLDANGEGDLLTVNGSITSVPSEMLIDGVRYGAVLDADGNQLHPILHYADFIRPQPTVFAYYTIKDKVTILTRAKGMAVNSHLDIQPVTGPLTITASYAPQDIEDYPPELEDRLVHALVEIVARKVTTPANANAKIT